MASKPKTTVKINPAATKHPEWEDHFDEWRLMRNTARGEKRMKDEGQEYLPMPTGFAKQPDRGVRMYTAYRTRAQFPEIVSPTILGMAGIICQVEIDADLPEAMMPLWDKATKDGMPLEAFFLKLVSEIMTTGRYAVLAEADREGSEIPYLCGYTAESLINWATDRSFFVLDESESQRDGYRWADTQKYRVLELVDGRYQQTIEGGEEGSAEVVKPARRGGDALDEIPLVVVGTMELTTEIQQPPLIGVARSALAMYQLSADYRYQLYATGQETLVIYNADAPAAVGAGLVISLKGGSKEDQPVKAEYVGPKGTGIQAHREAIKDEREAAAQHGAKLFDQDTGGQESGEAKKIRYAAQTATLMTIAITSASALEKSLRYIAIMMGIDPSTVVVRPNLSFLDMKLSPTEAKALVDMWMSRAISYETLYENLKRGELANAERSAEEELELIDEETVDDPRETGILPRNPQSGIIPADPNAPPEENASA
jgi:hypothetical protein